jgi:hypothetical protein
MELKIGASLVGLLVAALAVMSLATVGALAQGVPPTRAISTELARAALLAPAKAPVSAPVAPTDPQVTPGVSVSVSVAPVAPAASQPAPVVIAPVKPDDPKGTANVIKGAMHTSNWRLVVIEGLLLAVLLLRKVGGFCLPTKWAAWVQSDRGGAALAVLAGVLTVVVNGMVAGGKFDPQLLIDGVLAAATAAGGFNLAKRLAAPSDLPATPAGPNAPPVNP